MISRSKHTTPPGGAKLPCSQSRKVAAGVSILFAKSNWVYPALARAWRNSICSGVVTRPTSPAFTSANAVRISSSDSPASASIARATVAISKFHFISDSPIMVNLSGRHAVTLRCSVNSEKFQHTLFRIIEINHPCATTFTPSLRCPTHLARTFSAGNHISS